MKQAKPKEQDKREIIRSELRKMAERDELSPENVVKAARSPNCVFHDYFEWDNSKAAHQHRLYQARKFISQFEITLIVNRTEVCVQEFVENHSKKPTRQGYIPIQKLQTKAEMARDFMLHELKIAKTYVDKTFAYAKVLGLHKDIKSLSERLEGLTLKLEPK